MRIEKRQLVRDIAQMFDNSSYLYMISYKGLKVKEFNELRAKLQDNEAECVVLKNSLIKKAAEIGNKNEISTLDLSGDTAVVMGQGDPSAAAKSISEFAKKFAKIVKFKCGYLDGSILSGEEVTAISKLPSREVMLAQLLGVLEAPKRNLVSLLHNKLASIVYALNAYKNKISS